ncbi:hypothetical protein SLEP1_g49770 [Rubroshorea leprosula]|uniref:Uncharacterized protein n=1 Tax=Rubroshorea leprosula TaxID=152421 RepID=A0AAV5LYU1_9ROSI|nr:hypothetical protein SLEP1_g49770 [Rubroshorea leprosula]
MYFFRFVYSLILSYHGYSHPDFGVKSRKAGTALV